MNPKSFFILIKFYIGYILKFISSKNLRRFGINSLNFVRSLLLIPSDLYLTAIQAVIDSAKSSCEFFLAYFDAYFFLSNRGKLLT